MTTEYEPHPQKNHLRILEPISKLLRRAFQCVIEHSILQSMLSK